MSVLLKGTVALFTLLLPGYEVSGFALSGFLTMMCSLAMANRVRIL